MAKPKPRLFSPISMLLLFGFVLFSALLLRGAAPRSVSYNELLEYIRAGEITEVRLGPTEILALHQLPDEKQEQLRTGRLPEIEETPLLTELEASQVRYSGQPEASWLSTLLVWLLPLTFLWVIFFYLPRKNLGSFGIGKNRAQLYDTKQKERVTFDDVAGVDEAIAELREVVDFLKNPKKYQTLGARIPKGALLVGPPGTGKTLLAKAVAGEASVPFFSISGSDFVELFVGVGAARMRDLFASAKESSPCIIFLDELDAVGRSRAGVGAIATHEEREQTLNQLLVEIDGFSSALGVVILAATNRPEVLDPALLRAGRFDRQVLVDRPDLKGRRDILRIHTKRLPLQSEVNLDIIARRTPGMVGSDLANVANEAALAAARRGAVQISQADFEEALDRIQLGLKKQNRMMSEAERRRVAYHESGHTLVALSFKGADPVHRVSIIPRSQGALGATLQLPTEERYLITREELKEKLCVMLGGRAAEIVACGDISTGAQNDLERATLTAHQMICRFGMSDKLGPATFGVAGGPNFLSTLELSGGRGYSEEVARLIDEEVRSMLEAAQQQAQKILSARRSTLDELARCLLTEETLEQPAIEAILKKTPA